MDTDGREELMIPTIVIDRCQGFPSVLFSSFPAELASVVVVVRRQSDGHRLSSPFNFPRVFSCV
jgi:hypothetical protein